MKQEAQGSKENPKVRPTPPSRQDCPAATEVQWSLDQLYALVGEVGCTRHWK